MSEAVPSHPRYRCKACGNLTRFDVRITRTTSAFHHYTIGGELEIEDVETLAEEVEEVSCRWCNSAAGVIEIRADSSLSPVVDAE